MTDRIDDSDTGLDPGSVPGDADAFLDRVASLVNDGGLRRRLGRQAFEIAQTYNWDAVLARMDQALRQGISEIAAEIGLQEELEQIFYYAPIHFDDGCINAVRQATLQSGFSHREMVSGAGHDACYVSKVVPTSMIFIPCIDGISHNEVEDAKPEWVTAGAQVLLLSMLDKAGEAGGE